MERKVDRNFVLAVTFIMLSTVLSAQMITSPTGLVTQPMEPMELGKCYEYDHSPTPRATTFTNCCETSLQNHRWVGEDLRVSYC